MRPRSATGKLLALGLGAVVVLAIASAAHADRGRYVARSFNEPAEPGLTVSGPLQQFRVVSRARVVVPTEWRRQSARFGLRFITRGTRCRYRVAFTVRSRLSQRRAAADYVADALPSPAEGRLLEQGQRGGSAFRVVRARGDGSVVRLRAFWVALLTRRSDIAPRGQVAWSEIGVEAASRRRDECHAGTWRDVLGPQLGDALATARTRLHFVRARS